MVVAWTAVRKCRPRLSTSVQQRVVDKGSLMCVHGWRAAWKPRLAAKGGSTQTLRSVAGGPLVARRPHPSLGTSTRRLDVVCLVIVNSYARAGSTCFYCGDPAQVVDHVAPVTHGGTNDAANLVAACTPCNMAKSDIVGWDRRRTHKAPATRRAYAQQWAAFAAYCVAADVAAMPAHPATVADYLATLADKGCATSTAQLVRSAIGYMHKSQGVASPTTAPAVQATMIGIKTTLGMMQRKVDALGLHGLHLVVAELGGSAGDLRDRALLLLGFGGAFRRSELVALTVADLAPTAGGLDVTIRRSKTDQTGAGRVVAVPYGSAADVCAVRAVQAWIAAAGIADGAIFRSVDRHGNVAAAGLTGGAVARIVKARCAAAGLDADRYSGHSLRAGLARRRRGSR
jgi:site-specific recombinase XerD